MRIVKVILGGVCQIVGVVVIVDVWEYWALAVGAVLLGFSYWWLWYNAGGK